MSQDAAEQRDDSAEDVPDAPEYNFGFPIRPALRLGLVEKILGSQGIIQPAPTRQRLIDLINDGVLDGKKVGSFWIVYEDSFKAWVKKISGVE